MALRFFFDRDKTVMGKGIRMIQGMLSKHQIHFNEQQMAAATHGEGPAIVLAVAGAGKTTVMCTRIAHLMIREQIDPGRIRNVTFSKAAARDMQKRFLAIFHELKGSDQVSFSTIHSMAYHIVRSSYRQKGQFFQLIEDSRKHVYKPRLLRAIYREENNNYPGEDDMDELMQKISLVKNRMLTGDAMADISTSVPAFLEIYRRYEGYKKANGWLDYDDLLTQAYRLLQREKDLRESLQQQYTHWQVDEFQDTSLVQWKMIRLLAAPENNLFCVGDDDQMIYGFRGSDPVLLLNFKSELPGAQVFFMEENHRCGPQVIQVSNGIVGKNTVRYVKKAYTQRTKPCRIQTRAVNNLEEQVDRVLEEITGLLKVGNETLGVLYRNNLSALPIVDALSKMKMPFNLRDMKRNVLNHWIVQDLLGIIDLAYQPDNVSLFEQHYYKMNGYLSKEMMAWLKKNPTAAEESVLACVLRCPLLVESYQVKAARELTENLTQLTRKNGKSTLPFIMEKLGYSLYLDRKQGLSREMADQLLDIIAYLAKDLASPVLLRQRLESLRDNSGATGEKITLTTIHSAKGLEFDHVIMVDVMGGLFPSAVSAKAFEQQQDKALMEEERRLFYVALTRSKGDVSIYGPTHSFGRKVSESRFVTEIKQIKAHQLMGSTEKTTWGAAPTLVPGDAVTHHTFGPGQVTCVGDTSVEIRFGSHVKRIATDFLKKVLEGVS